MLTGVKDILMLKFITLATSDVIPVGEEQDVVGLDVLCSGNYMLNLYSYIHK